MRFPTRSLLSLTRCKLVQYAPKRGLHALQCTPGLNPRLRVPLRTSHLNEPPQACRRMFHTSFGEAPFVLSCSAPASDDDTRISGSTRTCDPAKAWNGVGLSRLPRPQTINRHFQQDQNPFQGRQGRADQNHRRKRRGRHPFPCT